MRAEIKEDLRDVCKCMLQEIAGDVPVFGGFTMERYECHIFKRMVSQALLEGLFGVVLKC